jgi:hypothetical protein
MDRTGFLDHRFWARGYFVTGRDEEVIRAYLRNSRPTTGSVGSEDFSFPKSNQSSQNPLRPPLAVPHQTSSFAGVYWLVSGTPKCNDAFEPIIGIFLLHRYFFAACIKSGNVSMMTSNSCTTLGIRRCVSRWRVRLDGRAASLVDLKPMALCRTADRPRRISC